MSTKITKKEMLIMDRNACSIKGVLNDVKVQIEILNSEIKASKKSKLEFERNIGLLEAKKNDLQKRVEANKEWAATYDLEVGPFAQKYEDMTKEIGSIYDKAKSGHARGIVILEKEFGYHPTFKRPQDTFTASAWLPK